MTEGGDRPGWIPDLEIENAQIKWAFSHFDGRADTFNDEGDHNFTVILSEQQAAELMEQGWPIKPNQGREEGDPVEYLLKIKISYRFEAPKIFLIKNKRKIRADERDLTDIKRTTTEQIDVIIQPSPWVYGGNSGITAYVKELYAVVKESQYAEKYADYEEVN